MCLANRWPMRVGLSEGGGWCAQHWHALVPTDTLGRGIARAMPPGAMGSQLPAAVQARTQWLAAFDARGGLSA